MVCFIMLFMKRIITILLIALTLSACNSLRFTYDKYKEQNTLRINQRLNTFTPQDNWIKKHYHFGTVTAEHFGQVDDNDAKTVTLTITHNYNQLHDQPDSLLFIDINGNITKLIATRQSSKEMVSAQTTQKSETTEDEENDEIETSSTSSISLQTTIRTKQVYVIPPELFKAFVSASTLSFRQYIGNQPIDIIPTYSERRLIGSFYEKVINK